MSKLKSSIQPVSRVFFRKPQQATPTLRVSTYPQMQLYCSTRRHVSARIIAVHDIGYCTLQPCSTRPSSTLWISDQEVLRTVDVSAICWRWLRSWQALVICFTSGVGPMLLSHRAGIVIGTHSCTGERGGWARRQTWIHWEGLSSKHSASLLPLSCSRNGGLSVVTGRGRFVILGFTRGIEPFSAL